MAIYGDFLMATDGRLPAVSPAAASSGSGKPATCSHLTGDYIKCRFSEPRLRARPGDYIRAKGQCVFLPRPRSEVNDAARIASREDVRCSSCWKTQLQLMLASGAPHSSQRREDHRGRGGPAVRAEDLQGDRAGTRCRGRCPARQRSRTPRSARRRPTGSAAAAPAGPAGTATGRRPSPAAPLVLIWPVTLTPPAALHRRVIATPVTWNGAWWKRRYSTTALAASRITVSAAQASPRHRRDRRGGSSRRPVRQMRSAVCAAPAGGVAGTPGLYLMNSGAGSAARAWGRLSSPAWRGSGCRTARPPRARRALHASAGRAGRFPWAGRATRLRGPVRAHVFGRRVGPVDFRGQVGPRVFGRQVGPRVFGGAGRGARFPSAGRGRGELRRLPSLRSMRPPAVLAATGSTWPRLRNVFFSPGSSYASAWMQTPPSRSSLPLKPVPCLDGAEPPLMLMG